MSSLHPDKATGEAEGGQGQADEIQRPGEWAATPDSVGGVEAAAWQCLERVEHERQEAHGGACQNGKAIRAGWPREAVA
jgi:hypothetical protein